LPVAFAVFLDRPRQRLTPAPLAACDADHMAHGAAVNAGDRGRLSALQPRGLARGFGGGDSHGVVDGSEVM
jgi:hypothetical protein